MPRPHHALLASTLLLVTACAGKMREPETRPVRVAGYDQPVAHGDCVEARRRAAVNPSLDVDRLPTPVSQRPKPLQKVPRHALRADGSADVKVSVVIDTTGRADMSTFKVVTASHPWFAANLRSVLPKWRFRSAELAGCKVPRAYLFMASAPGRKGKR